jgi:hypothetical protein
MTDSSIRMNHPGANEDLSPIVSAVEYIGAVALADAKRALSLGRKSFGEPAHRSADHRQLSPQRRGVPEIR